MSRNMDEPFWKYRHYVGKGGIRVEVEPSKGKRWRFRYTKTWYEAKDKFWALLDAAHAKGMSGQEADFTPISSQRCRGEPRSIYQAWYGVK